MADVIFKYFPGLTEKQRKQFELLYPLYFEWNQKINVISRRDVEHLYIKHVLHSLAIAKTFTFINETTALDFGTGGGFPGIPLAILFPEVKFLLADSIQKKIKVVQNIIEELGLSNVKTKACRVEHLNDTFDYITGRAVKSIPIILSWTEKLLKKKSRAKNSGIIYLTGGEIEKDLNKIRLKHRIIAISDIFNEEFFETKKVVRIYR